MAVTDRQAPISSPAKRIPILSPILHCLTMPCIVFLRWGFGYAFLRPFTVFFAFSYSISLFAHWAWVERQNAWPRYWAVAIFGLSSVVLFWCHFFIAYVRDVRGTGAHDYASGTSWPVKMFRRRSQGASIRRDDPWLFIIEPPLILIAAFVLLWGLKERALSVWLMWSAGLLFLKEYLTFRMTQRGIKRQADANQDALEMMEEEDDSSTPAPLGSARSPTVARKRRQMVSAEDELRFEIYGELLQIHPPYSLEQAEKNYRDLSQRAGRIDQMTPEYSAEQQKLNEAIAFFRKALRT